MANAMQRLQDLADDAVSLLYAQTRAADEARSRELSACIVVQKYCRGFLVRRRLDKFRDLVVDIQRTWRGYLGRQRAHAAREARDKSLRETYFNTKATNIQRHWRGFWSRKYLFDFYARKLYLQHVAQINAQVRADVAMEGEQAALLQKSLAEEAARKAFEAKVGQLHHLLSTTSQPGIFASPFAIATGTVPVIAGAPVEEHLKQVPKRTGRGVASLRASATTRPSHSPERTTGSLRMQRTAPGATAASGPPAFLPPISKGSAQRAPATKAAATLLDAAAGGEAAQGQTLGWGQGPVTSAGYQVTATCGHGGTGAIKQGTFRATPAFANTYPAEVEVGGLGVTVPRHTTLRQVVPYDAVQQAERLERKVVHTEMLLRHPLPFSHNAHMGHVPTVAVQTSRNLEEYRPMWDPTAGCRSSRFTPTQQAISPRPFAHHPAKTGYIDLGLVGDVSALPPNSYRPPPPPQHRAGYSSLELRKKHEPKPPKVLAS